jgi:hydrogenase/urease accessory protein HupE
MRTKLIFLPLLLLFVVKTVSAHRLNEYLQSTTITLSSDSIRMHLRMTAGTDIAPTIIKLIDTNGDGVFSAAEQQAYFSLVLHGTQLFIDGHAIALQPCVYSFPGIADMKAGSGEIALFVSAQLPAELSNHHMVFVNEHEEKVAVYLVNCLLPADARIHVTDQSRNNDQSIYTLDFTTAASLSADTEEQRLALEKTDAVSVVKTYFFHGIGHILSGYDHLLFICALVLGATTLWQLIKIVTAFTIAHSITLTLVVCNLVHVPQQMVELFISGSIVFVALQNIFRPQTTRGSNRLIIAFIFGLFHGLGFAGGLLAVMQHIDHQTVFLAIIGFTIGIEAGNQIVLLPLSGLLKILRNSRSGDFKKQQTGLSIQKIASVPIALGGLYYFIVALIG